MKDIVPKKVLQDYKFTIIHTDLLNCNNISCNVYSMSDYR